MRPRRTLAARKVARCVDYGERTYPLSETYGTHRVPNSIFLAAEQYPAQTPANVDCRFSKERRIIDVNDLPDRVRLGTQCP